MTRLHDPEAPDPSVGEFSAGELGAMLRESRLSLGREIEDVAAELRIRLVYLQAIEEGRLEDLPGIAYATGFVRAYGDALGLDGEDLVRRFKAAGMAITQATDLHLPSPVEEGRLPTGSVLLVAALLAVGAYGGWYYMSSQGRDPIEHVAALPNQLAELVGIEGEKAASSAENANAESATPTTTADATADPDTSPTTEAAVATATGDESASGDSPTTPASTSETASVPPAAPTVVARDDRPDNAPVAATTPESATDRTAAAPPPSPPEPASTPAAPVATAANDVPRQPPAAPKRKPAVEVRAPAPPPVVETEAPAEAPAATTIVAAATSGEAAAVSEPGNPAAVTPPPATHQVVLRANTDTWVEVGAAEQAPLLSRLMRQGETFVVPSLPGLMMATGNAGGIEILVDGKAIPRLGSVGEIRKNVALDARSLLEAAR